MKNPDNKKLTLSYQDKAKNEPEQGIIFSLFSLLLKRNCD